MLWTAPVALDHPVETVSKAKTGWERGQNVVKGLVLQPLLLFKGVHHDVKTLRELTDLVAGKDSTFAVKSPEAIFFVACTR